MSGLRYGPEVEERVCAELAEGKSLVVICSAEGMPSRAAVHGWMARDDEIAARILEAREVGFHLRAEKAVEAAKSATDPQAGRLAFDAEKWYLGKLSNAFREKPIALGVQINVGDQETFDDFASRLEEFGRAKSRLAIGTSLVALPSPGGSDNPGGELAGVAGTGGAGMGQDTDGG